MNDIEGEMSHFFKNIRIKKSWSTNCEDHDEEQDMMIYVCEITD